MVKKSKMGTMAGAMKRAVQAAGEYVAEPAGKAARKINTNIIPIGRNTRNAKAAGTRRKAGSRSR